MRSTMIFASLVFGLATGCATDSGDPSAGDCSCDVTYNGVSKSIACGTTDCVSGQSYTCGASADVSEGGSCSATGHTGSGSIECDTEICDAATEYCILSQSGSLILAGTCAPLPASCSSCDCIDDVEADWKSLNNNTNNCTGAVQHCTSHNGQVSVTCAK